MKRLRVPIDRHADGQLAEVLRKIVLVVPYCRLMQLARVGALVRFWQCAPKARIISGGRFELSIDPVADERLVRVTARVGAS